ncbi:hypothetical protein BZA77DRAFT_294648 [Pyronema omphalodes]|nr:hypothetical protein BZA77DRAFT_294648 [Pyronema omphalodes]
MTHLTRIISYTTPTGVRTIADDEGALDRHRFWSGPQYEHPERSTTYLDVAGFEDTKDSINEQNSVIDTELEQDPAKIMELGRVIETAVLTLKKEVTKDEIWKQQNAVNKLLDTAPGCFGYAAGFRVPKISTDSGNHNEFVILVAWESKEAHISWAKKEMENPNSPLHGYDKLVEKSEMWHVTLTYGYLSAAATAAME